MTSLPPVAFRASGLPLAVHCNRRIMNTLLDLLGEFLCSEDGCYQMHLGFNPDSGFVRDGEELFPGDPHRNMFTLLRWSRDRVDIDMKVLNRDAVSAAIGYLLVKALSENEGLLLHASMLVRAGRGYLFSGPSGAGKSTLAGNAKGMRYVHDDKAALRRQDGRWWAHGVPMNDGANGTGRNISAPVGGIYLIEKGNQLGKKPLAPRDALEEVSSQVIVPVEDMHTRTRAYQSLLALVSEVPFFRLRFVRDSDVSTIV